jgi:hypothetical protein
MRGLVAAAIIGLMSGFAASPAAAYVDCYPYCDFTHDYSPADRQWERPGKFCHPRCDRLGNCAPTPACVVQAPPAGRSAFVTEWVGPRPIGRITVRSRTVQPTR